MIKFFYHPSPNPAKVALFLEEAGLPYELVPVDTRRGDQHLPSFTALNPNAKTPAMVDGEAVIFDSNAILLYLAEKTGRFLPPATPVDRARLLSWLMLVATGIGPYSGQHSHFKHIAPGDNAYAAKRYEYETWRHWKLIDAELEKARYMLGDQYTIVDMAVWGWARNIPYLLGTEAWAKLPHVKRLLDELNARPAAQRAEQLKSRFAFKTEWDAESLTQVFPQHVWPSTPASK